MNFKKHTYAHIGKIKSNLVQNTKAGIQSIGVEHYILF